MLFPPQTSEIALVHWLSVHQDLTPASPYSSQALCWPTFHISNKFLSTIDKKTIYHLVFLMTIIPGTTAPPSVSPHHLSSEIIFTVSFIQRIRPSLARMTMYALKASMYIQKGRDV